MFALENFIDGLKITFSNIQLIKNEDKLLLSILTEDSNSNDRKIENLGEIPILEIKDTIEKFTDETTFNEYMLYKKKIFEAPIKSQNQSRMPLNKYFERNNIQVSEHNYEFNISNASPQYIIALMCFSSTHRDTNLDLPSVRYFRLWDNDYFKSLDEFCDLFRIMTVKIVTLSECSFSEFKRMIRSYLFNISYNCNNVFVVANLSEYRSPLRRSVQRGGQLFPYKSYKEELVKYYYQGVSTDIPFTQYLAFYHVAEFFFQTISEEDAFKEIKDFITRPSFSPHNEEDIRKFYVKIKKKIRDQREDGVWDEKTGLLLCLKKYITDIEVLKDAINIINPTAIEYYRNNCVPFADEGQIINFDDLSESIYVTIRNRIYSVRNAIVHSKEGEKSRYEPFKHDKDLSKEIPLIRAVAEEIIINSAKPMMIKHSE